MTRNAMLCFTAPAIAPGQAQEVALHLPDNSAVNAIIVSDKSLRERDPEFIRFSSVGTMLRELGDDTSFSGRRRARRERRRRLRLRPYLVFDRISMDSKEYIVAAGVPCALLCDGRSLHINATGRTLLVVVRNLGSWRSMPLQMAAHIHVLVDACEHVASEGDGVVASSAFIALEWGRTAPGQFGQPESDIVTTKKETAY